jgi:hypothetical protein
LGGTSESADYPEKVVAVLFRETALITWGVGASDAMLKRACLDFVENRETGRNKASRRRGRQFENAEPGKKVSK